MSPRIVRAVLALDNPAYSALTTDQASLAIGDGLARRYPSEISRLCGLHELTPRALADLAELTAPGETVGVIAAAPLAVTGAWELLRERWIEQMVLEDPRAVDAPAPAIVELGAADAVQMTALTAATDPGPWSPRTYEMGRYIGVRDGERLVAMAGERMRPAGAVEISAVCTDPAYTGRGYARALMTTLIAATLDAGKLPMLHVKNENGAKRLYEKLGFRVRREMRLTVLRRAP
jgi:ribosomal protein S18 acetylase RimI-like enzyme